MCSLLPSIESTQSPGALASLRVPTEALAFATRAGTATDAATATAVDCIAAQGSLGGSVDLQTGLALGQWVRRVANCAAASMVDSRLSVIVNQSRLCNGHRPF
jgi:hypothetical protein